MVDAWTIYGRRLDRLGPSTVDVCYVYGGRLHGLWWTFATSTVDGSAVYGGRLGRLR
jgi:hypothetical protein